MKTLPPSGRPALSDRQVAELLDRPDPETGRRPLEVMLANMQWYDGQASRLLAQIEKLIVRADDPHCRAEAQQTLREFLVMREKAQSAARDAAPYCHGRLITTDRSPLSREDSMPGNDIYLNTLMQLSSSPEDQVKAAAVYQQFIKGNR